MEYAYMIMCNRRRDGRTRILTYILGKNEHSDSLKQLLYLNIPIYFLKNVWMDEIRPEFGIALLERACYNRFYLYQMVTQIKMRACEGKLYFFRYFYIRLLSIKCKSLI